MARIRMGMISLVTGATGLVGFNIVEALRRRGRAVRCLVRSPEKAERLLTEEIEIIQGDVTDLASVAAAVEGCDVVYHAAGLPEQWLRDSATFERVNVGGTRNLVTAALQHGVKRFVYTSTIDVFAAARGAEYDESRLDPEPKATYYERSKQQADQVVVAAIERGLPAVLLHPSGVYGPGPTHSPGINQLFVDLRDGKIPLLLSGGVPLVYAPDVGEGHVLAEERLAEDSLAADSLATDSLAEDSLAEDSLAEDSLAEDSLAEDSLAEDSLAEDSLAEERAEVGRRFILSESFFTLPELAEHAGRELGLRRVPPVLPLWIGQLVSGCSEGLSKITGRPPLIPRGQLHFLQWGARPCADRARQELGWRPTPFIEGLRGTLDFLAG